MHILTIGGHSNCRATGANPMQNVLKTIKGLLAAVGAVVGGITAIFSAVGFLAETSHARLLGLPDLAIAIENYLLTGARFFTDVVILMPHYALLMLIDFLLLLLGRVVPVLLIFLIAGLIWIAFRRFAGATRFQPIAEKLRNNLFHGAAGLVVLLIGLLIAWIYFLPWIVDPLKERDLLFTDMDLALLFASPPVKASLSQNLMLARETVLVRHFGIVLFLTIGFVALAFFTYRVLKRLRPSAARKPTYRIAALLCYVFFFLVAVTVLCLPMNYGVLLGSNHRPVLEIESAASQSADQADSGVERLALLKRDGSFLYLYAPQSRTISMHDQNEFKNMRVIGNSNIFNPYEFKVGDQPRNEMEDQ